MVFIVAIIVGLPNFVGVLILLALVDDALMALTTLVIALPRKLYFLNLGHHYGFFINNLTIVHGKPHVWFIILKCYRLPSKFMHSLCLHGF